MPAGADMLPMIVGSIPEPVPDPEPESEAEIIDAETVPDDAEEPAQKSGTTG